MEDDLYAEAETLGIGDRFWIRNGIAEKNLPYYYNFGDGFALPSLYEPAGLVILEALACGCTSVASKVGGIPEMMDGYGLYAEPENVDQLADRIDTRLRIAERWRRWLGEVGSS